MSDDDEHVAQFTEALEYREKIRHAISRAPFRLHSRADIGSGLITARTTPGYPGCPRGKQANVSVNARMSTQRVQQPKLQTEARVQRQLIVNNDKAEVEKESTRQFN